MSRLPKYLAMVALGTAAAAALPSLSYAADKAASGNTAAKSSSSSAAAADTDYGYVQANQLPAAVKTTAGNETKGGKDIIYQKQTTGGKSVYSVHYTDAAGKRMAVHIDSAGKVVKGPFAYDDSKDRAEAGAQAAAAKSGGGAASATGGEAQFRKVGAQDLPAAVNTALTGQTKGGKDVIYYSQIRDGQQIYSSHWTAPNGKRMFVRVDGAGKVILGPGETTEENGKSIASNEPWNKEQLNGLDQVPAAARAGIQQATNAGTNYNVIKLTRGPETRYYVEYDVAGGRRTSAIFNSEGKLVEGESATAAPTAAAPPAAQPADTAQPAAAQIGAAAPAAAAAAGPWALVGVDQLPAPVRAAANAELTGSTDQIIQRFTEGAQTVYGIDYANANGQRKFMAVDASGKVTVEPRKSNLMEGGKGVTIKAIGPEAMTAEARKTVEGLNAVNALFVERTGQNGKKEYLVQYNVAGSNERMEAKFGEDGKLDGKPHKAKEQPLSMEGGKKQKK